MHACCALCSPCVAHQVGADDDDGHAGGANVLLGASVDQAVLLQRKGERERGGGGEGGGEEGARTDINCQCSREHKKNKWGHAGKRVRLTTPRHRDSHTRRAVGTQHAHTNTRPHAHLGDVHRLGAEVGGHVGNQQLVAHGGGALGVMQWGGAVVRRGDVRVHAQACRRAGRGGGSTAQKAGCKARAAAAAAAAAHLTLNSTPWMVSLSQ